MTTKEKIRNGVAKIAAESKDIKNDIIRFVGDEYKKTIELKDQTSDMVKEITKGTLDGVYEGMYEAKNKSLEVTNRLKDKGIKIEDVMKKTAETMVNVAKEEGKTALIKSKKGF